MYHAHVRMVSLTDADYDEIMKERKKSAGTATGQQQ